MNSEYEEQRNFVSWLRFNYPEELIFSIPNGANKSPVIAKKFKLEGLLAGVPDLFIPGKKLFIEMKREKGGVLSENQKNVMQKLEKCGYQCVVAEGFDEAKNHYLTCCVTLTTHNTNK